MPAQPWDRLWEPCSDPRCNRCLYLKPKFSENAQPNMLEALEARLEHHEHARDEFAQHVATNSGLLERAFLDELTRALGLSAGWVKLCLENTRAADRLKHAEHQNYVNGLKANIRDHKIRQRLVLDIERLRAAGRLGPSQPIGNPEIPIICPQPIRQGVTQLARKLEEMAASSDIEVEANHRAAKVAAVQEVQDRIMALIQENKQIQENKNKESLSPNRIANALGQETLPVRDGEHIQQSQFPDAESSAKSREIRRGSLDAENEDTDEPRSSTSSPLQTPSPPRSSSGRSEWTAMHRVGTQERCDFCAAMGRREIHYNALGIDWPLGFVCKYDPPRGLR